MIPRSLLLLLFQLFLFLLLFLGRNQISLSVVLLDGPANQKGQIQFPVWWNIKFCGLTDIAVIKFYTGDLCMSTKNMGQNTASSIYSKFKVENSSMISVGGGVKTLKKCGDYVLSERSREAVICYSRI